MDIRNTYLTLLLASVMCLSINVYAFEKYKIESLSSFEHKKNIQLEIYNKVQKKYLASFDKAKQKISKIWDDPKLSDKTKWIEYSKDLSIRRTVDFEQEKITVEILGDNISQEKAYSISKNELTKVQKQTISQALSNDLVITDKMDKKKNSSINYQIFNDVKPYKEPVKISHKQNNAGQKVTKLEYRLESDLPKVMSQNYVKLVNENAKKWSVPADLIMAIIHVESHFNPVAQSSVPAYGLMQVVPASAGRDVTKIYAGKENLLSAALLFEPKFNIEVGSAYLNILNSRYLSKISNTQSRHSLIIASYNGGIGAVAKYFTNSTSLTKLAETVNKLTPDEVFHELSNKFPFSETRDYMKKVSEKRNLYRSL